jgi:hypothetical protein
MRIRLMNKMRVGEGHRYARCEYFKLMLHLLDCLPFSSEFSDMVRQQLSPDSSTMISVAISGCVA